MSPQFNANSMRSTIKLLLAEENNNSLLPVLYNRAVQQMPKLSDHSLILSACRIVPGMRRLYLQYIFVYRHGA